MGKRRNLLIAAVAALCVAIPAFAAPPGNDDRGDARAVSVPSTVNGTTRDATRQGNDPGTSCSDVFQSVWYSFDPTADQRVSMELSAQGDLQASLSVYRRERSTLSELECDGTNRRGEAAVTFSAKKDERYLILVGQEFGSEPGDFTLELFAPEPEATPPGRRLPKRGGTATVDRTRDITDAWSKRLTQGRTYVVALASRSEACPSVAVYLPNTPGFEGFASERRARCNQHRLYTPARTGRYSFLVRAGRSFRGIQRYKLRVRPARRDDTAPGRTIRNYQRVRGRVGAGRADVVDLLRFHVNRRSDVNLRFVTSTDLRLELRNVRGRFLDSAEGTDLRTRLGRGRYYAVVRSRRTGGKYTLQPAIRDITTTRIRFNGRRESVIGVGQVARADVFVTPAASGRITIVVERLDPLEGWQFHKRFTRRTSIGRATASFVPRRPGRFRARAEYSGSRLSASSSSGTAFLSAREPF